MPPFFLIGYMGSGKSYTGRRLAELLAIPFIDLDEAVERRRGESIAALVARDGIEAFRRVEATALRDTPRRPAVIACGGGTPTFGTNLEWMNARGITCYLATPVPVLVKRLLPERAERPLIAGVPEAALTGFVRQHLSERLPYYHRAHLRYAQTTGKEPVAEELHAYLSRIVGH